MKTELEFYDQMYYEDGYFILPVRAHADYHIEAERIKTPLDLIQWVRHLAGKKWMGRRRIRDFVDGVCEQKGWEGRFQ